MWCCVEFEAGCVEFEACVLFETCAVEFEAGCVEFEAVLSFAVLSLKQAVLSLKH